MRTKVVLLCIFAAVLVSLNGIALAQEWGDDTEAMTDAEYSDWLKSMEEEESQYEYQDEDEAVIMEEEQGSGGMDAGDGETYQTDSEDSKWWTD